VVLPKAIVAGVVPQLVPDRVDRSTIFPDPVARIAAAPNDLQPLPGENGDGECLVT